MTGNNLVSIVIPAYNHEKYIQTAITSAINQTYENIELIIINDGSNDRTWDKILEYKYVCEERFRRVIMRTQENRGTCATLNRALDLVQGEYFFLLASDDIVLPDTIQILYDFLLKHNDHLLVVGDNLIINEDSEQVFWDRHCKNTDTKKAIFKSFADFLIKSHSFIDFHSEDFGLYDNLLISNHIPNGYMIRVNIFDKIGYFITDAPLEDYWLMLQIAKYGKIKYINQATYCYRWHSNNTVKNRKKMINLTEKTLLYEQKLVNCLENKKWAKCFQEIVFSKKNYFNIGSLISLYKQRSITKNSLILQIGKLNIKLF